MSNIIVIYDTEATCWGKADGTSSWWSEDWQEPEIIQISAIKVETDNFTEVGDIFDVFIKPIVNPKLSPYCTALTSITDQRLDKEGVSFLEASKLFNAYCESHTPHSYGGDHAVMNYNREDLYKLESQIAAFTGENIRELFLNIDPTTKDINSGALSAHFRLAFKANQHYALDDCRSINASLQHFKKHPDLVSYFNKHP
jgi:inhibitor of KinA sporulation pathway (predicted exonuclease)